MSTRRNAGAYTRPLMTGPASVTLQVAQRPGGGVIVSSPDLPGWARHVRGPQVAAVVDEALREAAIAAYARARGAAYDAADLTEPAQAEPAQAEPGPARARPTAKAKQHDPADWVPLPDGRWRSPKGLTWPAETATVQKVIAQRLRLGLPVYHPDAPPPTVLPAPAPGPVKRRRRRRKPTPKPAQTVPAPVVPCLF